MERDREKKAKRKVNEVNRKERKERKKWREKNNERYSFPILFFEG